MSGGCVLLRGPSFRRVSWWLGPSPSWFVRGSDACAGKEGDSAIPRGCENAPLFRRDLPRVADTDDAPLEVLLLPFVQGVLAWPAGGRVLFLRARDGWALRRFDVSALICEQGFKPFSDALQRAGLQVREEPEADDGERFDLVLVLPPRQRDEARALLARAVASVAPGGRVVACQANDEGAKSGEADLKALAGAGGVLTKQHCRVFWTQPLHGAADADLLAKWRALDAPRRIADGRYLSRPGVFAWDRLDAGSRLLVEHLPADLGGRAADLGAGFGYLSDALLRRNPGIVALDLHEAEARALAMARHNLAGQAQRVALGYLWHDVTAGLVQRYDVIVTNPPFHAPGRAERPDIGRRFIAVAAEALNPGGRLWLVANRHLPYEAVLDEAFGQARIVAERDGYKVVEARKAR